MISICLPNYVFFSQHDLFISDGQWHHPTKISEVPSPLTLWCNRLEGLTSDRNVAGSNPHRGNHLWLDTYVEIRFSLSSPVIHRNKRCCHRYARGENSVPLNKHSFNFLSSHRIETLHNKLSTCPILLSIQTANSQRYFFIKLINIWRIMNSGYRVCIQVYHLVDFHGLYLLYCIL